MTIIVEFGSSVRGDNDSYSDKDTLVVPNKEEKMCKYQGCHVYSKKRLLKIKEHRSLFLVHLRNESKIISDNDGWMQMFLRNIPSYVASQNEINKSKKHLVSFLSITPSKEQQTWWMDCTYVFLRDYLIKRNSLGGHYIFSPLEFGRKEFTCSSEDLSEVIMSLRIGKSVHRSSNAAQLPTPVSWIKEFIIKALNFTTEEMSLSHLYFKRHESDPYFELRLIEGLLLSGKITSKNDRLLKLIRNPQMYSWHIRQRSFLKEINWVSPAYYSSELKVKCER